MQFLTAVFVNAHDETIKMTKTHSSKDTSVINSIHAERLISLPDRKDILSTKLKKKRTVII